jgi:hypothetical protein
MGQMVTLVATIESAKDVTGIKIKWVLPNEVRVVSGVTETVITSLAAGNVYRSQITIQQNDFSNQQIHFIASGDLPGIHFSSVSQYNTADEDFFRQQKQMVLKSMENLNRKKDAKMIH